MKNVLFCVILCLFYGCSQQYSYLQQGDLLFIQAKESNLSGAISRVTKQGHESSYDHIAIIDQKGDSIFVLHAAPEKGSVKESLKTFLKNYKSRTIDLFRLKPAYQSSIIPAVKTAHTLLGYPYNTSYILAADSYYCSDFIERSFRQNNIFQLNPMTFINPETGKVDEFWKNFYSDLNIEVPEGKPGCNPNGLSQSDKIYKVKTDLK